MAATQQHDKILRLAFVKRVNVKWEHNWLGKGRVVFTAGDGQQHYGEQALRSYLTYLYNQETDYVAPPEEVKRAAAQLIADARWGTNS